MWGYISLHLIFFQNKRNYNDSYLNKYSKIQPFNFQILVVPIVTPTQIQANVR